MKNVGEEERAFEIGQRVHAESRFCLIGFSPNAKGMDSIIVTSVKSSNLCNL